MAALAEQIESYRRMLPEIRREHGSVWALLVDNELKGTFEDFQEAAKYTLANFPGKPPLIRHTDERRETVPFVVLEE